MSLLPPTTTADEPFPPTVLVHGPGSDTATHTHHCMHLAVARTGSLGVSIQGAPPRHVAGAWIGPDIPHAIEASGTDLLLLFFDPESHEGRVIRRHAAPILLLDDAARDHLLLRWPTRHGSFRDEAFVDAACETIGVDRHAPPALLHPGVRRALAHLRGASSAVPLAELARAAGLSESRIGHLFTEEIGIPPRRYLLWMRVQRAAGGMAAGMPITEAAHAAGFSDGAHLSRTFRRMFGATPSEVAKSSQFMQAP